MTIYALNHITLAVIDIERSFYFYNTVLGLRPLVRWDKGAYFLVGGFWFCLNLDLNRQPSSCYTHYAFSVDQAEFGFWKDRLRHFSIETFKENTSPGDSLYFLDPDGHKLEIHVSNWRERVRVKKVNSGLWKDIQWFI